ncbi:MAG: sulfate ABC transporter substrate-binding protein [Candidatus Margulisiibacteriota bacterium]
MKTRLTLALLAFFVGQSVFGTELLNVSYDPTRELYQDINAVFKAEWKAKTGETVTLRQSHGGSGKQARGVIDGLEADVVTLALGYDIEAIQKAGLIGQNWASALPNHSVPFTSAIVLVVRKGNPKSIHDWNDLIKPNVAVITPNPKTSGGARWNYMAAWAYAQKTTGSEEGAKAFVTKLYARVPVLDSGARGSTTTFIERGIGDVLIAWENEALLIAQTLKPGSYEIVYPSISILAETPVAVVDSVAKRHGTTTLAKAYLQFLYSKQAQELAAKHHFRPTVSGIKSSFKPIKEVTISDFGGWAQVQRRHFADGGIFDKIFRR